MKKLTLYEYPLKVQEIFIEKIKERAYNCDCTKIGKFCPFFSYDDIKEKEHYPCLAQHISFNNNYMLKIFMDLTKKYNSLITRQEEMEV